MATESFEPRIGDLVSVQGQYGNFRVTAVTPCTDNWRITEERGWVDLEEETTRFRLNNVPWSALNMQELIARRIIERLKQQGEFPESLSGYYSIESGLDHESNPALYLSFEVPADTLSKEAISKLTSFRQVVSGELRRQSLLKWWPYIRFISAKEVLDVAS